MNSTLELLFYQRINFFCNIKRPLDGVQSCLKSLRQQMSDLQQNIYEEVGSSSMWNYKLGFTCEKCEMRWEIEHQVKDDNKEDEEFLECSITRQMPRCNCAIRRDSDAQNGD